jgi:hypothetical protein
MMTTISKITNEMKLYNRFAAPGSECNAWQDFHADCHARFGFGPDDDAARCLIAPEDFVEYWLAVVNDKSDDYEPETGARKS